MGIPFNKPFLTGKEIEYISQAYKNMHFSGNGPFTNKCQILLKQILEVPKVLLTTSCTHALEMSALLLNIKDGDEVIAPSFTFVSTVNAFKLRGARPKFIDIRPDTLNMDEAQLEKLITSCTKAIVPVHYAGIGCEMDRIMGIANRYNIPVVEDNAHGFLGTYNSKYLGTFGCLAVQSFHETKNIICGEGGALIINNPIYIERAEIIWEKGTNRSKFLSGEVDKYTWLDIGSSYLPSDILAAFLYAQLESREEISNRRTKIFDYYYQSLIPLTQKGLLTLPKYSQEHQNKNHMFYILLEDEKTRDTLLGFMRSNGVYTVFHYLPLHLSPMGISMGYKEGQLPITESVAGRLLRLPFYTELKQNEQAEVIKHIYDYFSTKPGCI